MRELVKIWAAYSNAVAADGHMWENNQVNRWTATPLYMDAHELITDCITIHQAAQVNPVPREGERAAWRLAQSGSSGARFWNQENH